MKAKAIYVRTTYTTRKVVFFRFEPENTQEHHLRQLLAECGFGKLGEYLFCWIPGPGEHSPIYQDNQKQAYTLYTDYPEVMAAFEEVYLDWENIPDGSEIWVERSNLDRITWVVSEVTYSQEEGT